MHRFPDSEKTPRPVLRSLAVVVALATTLAVAAAPLSAQQSDLDMLGSTTENPLYPGYFTIDGPVVGRLTDDRFITVQRQSSPYKTLLLRSWEVGPTGNIVELHEFPDLALGHETVESVVGLGPDRFVTLLRPSANQVHLVSWSVSPTGVISKVAVEATLNESIAPVELVAVASGLPQVSRVMGACRGSFGTGTVLRSWDVDDLGQIVGTSVLDVVADAVENAIATNGNGKIVLAQRTLPSRTAPTGTLRVTRFHYVAAFKDLDPEVSGTGPAIEEVDVTYTRSGEIATAVRLPSGSLQVDHWKVLTLWPTTVQILFSASSAATPGTFSQISIEPLMDTKLATYGVNGSLKGELVSWSSSPQVAPLDQLAIFGSVQVGFGLLDWDDLVSVSKGTWPFSFRATAWTDLVPE